MYSLPNRNRRKFQKHWLSFRLYSRQVIDQPMTPEQARLALDTMFAALKKISVETGTTSTVNLGLNESRLGLAVYITLAHPKAKANLKAAGKTDADLAEAREYQRKAQFYLDFIEAENCNLSWFRKEPWPNGFVLLARGLADSLLPLGTAPHSLQEKRRERSMGACIFLSNHFMPM